MSPDINKIPPHDFNVEQNALGLAMIDEQAVMLMLAEIEDEKAFYIDRHQKIFRAFTRLHAKSLPINILTVTENLKTSGEIDEIGGGHYLSTLVSGSISPSQMEFCCIVIKEKYALRCLQKIGMEITESTFEASTDVRELVGNAQSQIDGIDLGDKKHGFIAAGTIFRGELERYEQAFTARLAGQEYKFFSGVSTGFKDFDAELCGLSNEDLIIIAGRPSHGKTAFMLNIVRRISIDGDVPLGIFSLEMEKKQLVRRLICDIAGMEYSSLLRADFSRDDFSGKIMRAWKKINASQIYIDDSPALTAYDIRVRAHRLFKQHKIKAVMIDHLGWIRAHARFQNRNLEIGAICKVLKQVNKELEIPVIALCQLNRDMERQKRQPQLSDLRDSGEIEQDADGVIFVFRPDFNEGIAAKSETEAMQIIVSKWRNGPLTMKTYQYLKKYMRIVEVTRQYDNAITQPPTGIDNGRSHFEPAYDEKDLPF